jgi:hypothetical protein
VLRAVGSCAGEPTIEHAQVMYLLDLELLPSVRRTAPTLAADLKTEQALDAASDPIVVRLDDSGASSFVHEFDEALVSNRAHEIVIHCFTTEPGPSERSNPLRTVIF